MAVSVICNLCRPAGADRPVVVCMFIILRFVTCSSLAFSRPVALHRRAAPARAEGRRSDIPTALYRIRRSQLPFQILHLIHGHSNHIAWMHRAHGIARRRRVLWRRAPCDPIEWMSIRSGRRRWISQAKSRLAHNEELVSPSSQRARASPGDVAQRQSTKRRRRSLPGPSRWSTVIAPNDEVARFDSPPSP